MKAIKNSSISFLKTILNPTQFKKDVINYLITSFFIGFGGFFISYFLTRNISIESFGYLETINSLTALATSVVLWGGSIFVMHYYDVKSAKNEYNSSVLLIVGLTSSLLFIALIVYFITKKYLFEGLYITVFSFLSALYNLILTSFQLERKTKKYLRVVLLNLAISLSLTIILIYYWPSMWARLIPLIVGLAISLCVIFRHFFQNNLNGFEWNIKLFRYAIVLGAPLVVGQIGSWALERSDRLIITQMLGLKDTAIYGLGYQISMVMLLVQSAISKTWIPHIQSQQKLNNRSSIAKTIWKVSFLYLLMAILVSVIGFVYIKYFITKEYFNAVYIIPIVSFGYAFDGIWGLFNSISLLEKKHIYYLRLVLVVGAENLILNIILLNFFGIMGAALATLLSFMTGCIMNAKYVINNLDWFNEEKR